MRILYIITKSNWGGAQRHVYDLATAMKAKGHEVMIALGGNGILQQRLESASIFTYPIESLARDVSVSKDFKPFKEICSIIKNKRPDIIHLHSPKAAGLGALAGRILRVKNIIVTVHGWTFNESRPFYERIVIAFFSWLTMILAHTTILLSEYEYAQALKFPFVEHKIKLISPGIQPHILMSVDGAKQFIGKHIGMDLNSFNKRFTIGTIAELHPNKGLPYLIDAMEIVTRQYPQTVCVIIGDGEDRTVLGSLIKEKKLEQNIFLAGYIDQASEYLKAFNIFVLPSIKEGMPYAILEAGCASMPVVATPAGGIPEIIEDMRSGIIIQAKNSRELSHGISFMIENTEERRRYGAALRERVISKFSLERMLGEVEKLYLESK
ncbi:MAG: glycosyltransferase family 4 protein [Candidatus Taylorbacteria bacterium]|nr:glycosyltransferase family 4 protein [Candidatus Taylorbacteria bacterium]